MNFTEAHTNFMDQHLSARRGECARRLQEGHGHAEKMFLEAVWWPAFGHFQYLHPEYEVSDFRDGFRYLDFAYLRGRVQLAIEIDGYGPHWRNISRSQFSDHCRRQNDLITDGWKVLRFTYDDVKDSPRYCQQKVQQFMGRWLGEEHQIENIDWVEREILRIFLKLGRTITPADICKWMNITEQTARKWLRRLAAKHLIAPASGQKRIRSYRLNMDMDRYPYFL